MSDAFGVINAGLDFSSQALTTLQTVLINAQTLAGSLVEISRDEAFSVDDVAAIALYIPVIRREWLGDSPASFKATYQLVIVAVIYRPLIADCIRDTDTLRVQIENAVLTSPAFWSLPIERVQSTETNVSFPADADPHQGVIRMVIECECTDIFPLAINPLQGAAPIGAIGAPLTQANLTIPGDAPNMVLIGATILIPSTGA